MAAAAASGSLAGCLRLATLPCPSLLRRIRRNSLPRSPVMAASRVSVAAPLVLAVLVLLLAPSSPLALARGLNSVDPAAAGGGTRRACTYTVRVKTSCASPRRTTDAVSLAFGDAYRNEAHAPRLPNGANGGVALGRCATDTFRVGGPRGYGVCYLYLRRAGRDGWAPEWVQVVQPGPEPTTATFYFGDPLPYGVWYGHDRCPKAAPASSDSQRTATAAAVDDARRATNNSSSASPRG